MYRRSQPENCKLPFLSSASQQWTEQMDGLNFKQHYDINEKLRIQQIGYSPFFFSFFKYKNKKFSKLWVT